MALPPGYDRVASDGDLARVLGLEAHGFLLLLMRLAAPTASPAGGWAVIANVDIIASESGFGRGKTMKLLSLLEGLKLIVTDPGRHLGKGLGTLPSRRFLATDPSMSSPTPTHPNANTRSNTVADTPSKVRQLQNRPVYQETAYRHLAPVPASNTVPESTRVINIDDDYSSHKSMLERSNPSVLAALKSIGWVGAPPATDAPDDVVIALASWVKTRDGIKKRAAYLRRLLTTPGEAIRLAAELGLASPLGSTAAYADATAGMSHTEYVQRCIDNPEWEVAVTTEARRRASTMGASVSMALVREVAAEMAG